MQVFCCVHVTVTVRGPHVVYIFLVENFYFDECRINFIIHCILQIDNYIFVVENFTLMNAELILILQI